MMGTTFLNINNRWCIVDCSPYCGQFTKTWATKDNPQVSWAVKGTSLITWGSPTMVVDFRKNMGSSPICSTQQTPADDAGTSWAIPPTAGNMMSAPSQVRQGNPEIETNLVPSSGVRLEFCESTQWQCRPHHNAPSTRVLVLQPGRYIQEANLLIWWYVPLDRL